MTKGDKRGRQSSSEDMEETVVYGTMVHMVGDGMKGEHINNAIRRVHRVQSRRTYAPGWLIQTN